MKINYDHILTAPDGESYKDEKGKDLTVKAAIITSAAFALPGDETLTMVQKFGVGEIGMLAHKGLDLTAEQIATVKERSAKGFESPLLVYILHTALEGGDQPA